MLVNLKKRFRSGKMINEVMARHIRKGLVENIRAGRSAAEILTYEIVKREYTINGLNTQRKKEEEEVLFLSGLDANELGKEAEEKVDG